MRSIGDLATLMTSQRRQSDIRQTAETAAQTGTTGVAQNKAQLLGSKTSNLSLLDRKMELLQQYQSNIAEARLRTAALQSSLERISTRTSDVFNSIALVSQVESKAELKILSVQAAEVFVDVINTTNVSTSGTFLFSGTATATKPLPVGGDVLAQLKNDLAGLTDAAVISNAIDDWFDNPTGPFQSILYGGTTVISNETPIGADVTVQTSTTAVDENLRNALKALAKSALAGDASFQLSVADQKELFLDGQQLSLQSIPNIVNMQATLGIAESRIDSESNRNETLISRLQQERLDLIAVDQFESITEFEALQQQLDVSYRIAARQSQTSLAEYLR